MPGYSTPGYEFRAGGDRRSVGRDRSRLSIYRVESAGEISEV
jgi:hypothetical protein